MQRRLCPETIKYFAAFSCAIASIGGPGGPSTPHSSLLKLRVDALNAMHSIKYIDTAKILTKLRYAYVGAVYGVNEALIQANVVLMNSKCNSLSTNLEKF